MSKAKNDHLEEENKEAEVASEEIKEETEETTEAKPEEAEEKPKAKKSSKKTDNSKKSTKQQEEPKEEETEKKPSAEQQVKEANDKYLRLMAEYDNYRKRSQKEREALYGDIKADVLNKFLPVYDNLVRALDQPTEDEAYRKGENLGVTEIESVGQPFDPNLHNAVMHVEDETKGENEIVEVFQKGFKLGDKVIRFAMVKVAN